MTVSVYICSGSTLLHRCLDHGGGHLGRLSGHSTVKTQPQGAQADACRHPYRIVQPVGRVKRGRRKAWWPGATERQRGYILATGKRGWLSGLVQARRLCPASSLLALSGAVISL